MVVSNIVLKLVALFKRLEGYGVILLVEEDINYYIYTHTFIISFRSNYFPQEPHPGLTL
jgi:hypothetical protein